MPVAYKLVDEYSGTREGTDDPVFLGGVIAVSDDRQFDVGEALDEGDGTITIDANDARLRYALDQHPALEQTTATAGATVTDGLEDLKVDQLRGLADERGLDVGGLKKDEIVAALRGETAPDESGEGDDEEDQD